MKKLLTLTDIKNINTMKKVLGVFSLLILCFNVFAVNGIITTSTSKGTWNSTNNIWNNGIPGAFTTGSPGRITLDKVNGTNTDATINHSINTGSLALAFDNNPVITINGGDTLTVGNSTTDAASYNMIVVKQNANPTFNVIGTSTNPAVFIVNGDFQGNSQFTLNVTNGIVVINGTFYGANNANIKLNINSGGVLYVRDDIQLDQNVSLTFDGAGAIVVDGNVNMQGANGALKGVMAVQGTSTTKMVLQSSDVISIYSDNTFTVQQDNSPQTGPAGPKDGTYAEFAALYPYFCSISTYCRNNYQALPVVWKSVQAKNSNDGVIVSWGTYSEKNNAYYEIERSVNGITWEVVGNVAGNGTTEIESNYTFLDITAEAGLNYYRIKQVDFDGQSDYSTIAFVEVETIQIISGLYPNPNSGTFTLQFTTDEISNIIVRTAQGVEVSSSLVKSNSGYSVSIDNASAGFYTVFVQSNGKTYQAKFVIQ